jgi:hypothetical protein
MYAFKCIASTNETDQMLDDISVFRTQFHTYHIKDTTFRVYTSLSNASVHCTFYIISWDEWEGDIVTEVVNAIKKNEMPLALLFFNIPTTLSEDDFHSFTSIYTHAQYHSIPFIFKRKEREVRDETYYQLFSYFLHKLEEQRKDIENTIVYYQSKRNAVDYLYFLNNAKEDYCKHIHGKQKYLLLQTRYKKSLNNLVQYTNLFPHNIIEQDRVYNIMIRYHKELYEPFHAFSQKA